MLEIGNMDLQGWTVVEFRNGKFTDKETQLSFELVFVVVCFLFLGTLS